MNTINGTNGSDYNTINGTSAEAKTSSYRIKQSENYTNVDEAFSAALVKNKDLEKKDVEERLGKMADNVVNGQENKSIREKYLNRKTKVVVFKQKALDRYTDEETNKTDEKIYGEVITNKNYIDQAKSGNIEKGGNVSNIFKDLSEEDKKELKGKGIDINDLSDALSPTKVKEKSEAFVNVLSNSLKKFA